MTSFYDKYLLSNNILKKDYTLNYNDYEKLKISEQYNKIYNQIYKKNIEYIENNENEKIYNLSFSVLLKKSGVVYINILNDLSKYFSNENKNKNINELGYILTKNDNLLYIGILILIISFLLWIIDVTR
jgi:hypothetical protein